MPRLPKMKANELNEHGFYYSAPLEKDLKLRPIQHPNLTIWETKERVSENGIVDIGWQLNAGSEFIGFLRALRIPRAAANFYDCDSATDTATKFWLQCGSTIQDHEYPYNWLFIELLEIRRDHQGKGLGTELLRALLRQERKVRTLALRLKPLHWTDEGDGCVSLSRPDREAYRNSLKRLIEFYERFGGSTVRTEENYFLVSDFSNAMF